jgi:hypothetical protein
MINLLSSTFLSDIFFIIYVYAALDSGVDSGVDDKTT